MPLLADICRCWGDGCIERQTCQRYRDLVSGTGDRTPYMAASGSITGGKRCLDRIPVEPSEAA